MFKSSVVVLGLFFKLEFSITIEDWIFLFVEIMFLVDPLFISNRE